MKQSATKAPTQFNLQEQSRRNALAILVDKVARRILDVIAALFGLILLSPLFLILSILIRRDSPGPVFYRGLRAGKAGKSFRILKFRTMYESPESYQGPVLTAHGDPRVTPIGRWLRETKLNEIPQLLNLLKGEMSLVGPRPEHPDIVAAWPEDVRQELLSIRPGITSPASVVYRDEERLLKAHNIMDVYLKEILPSKLRLDQQFIRNRSILMDLDVVFWTLVILIPQLRRMPIPQHLLYWGPISRFFTRHLTWFLIDFPIALGAVLFVGLIWRMSGPLHIGVGVAAAIAVSIAVLFSLINLTLGLTRVAWHRARPEDVLGLGISTWLTTLVLVIVNQLWPQRAVLPSSMIVTTGLVAFLGFVGVRYRSRLITGFASRWLRLRGGIYGLGERVLVVSSGEAGQLAVWLLRKAELGDAFPILGMVDDDPRKQGMFLDGVEVLGTTLEIPAIVKEKEAGLLVLALGNLPPAEQDRALSICRQTQARVVTVPDIIGSWRAQVLPDDQGSFLPISMDRGRSAGDTAHVASDVLVERLSELENLVQARDWHAASARIRNMKAIIKRGQDNLPG